MFMRMLYNEHLAQASYLVGCAATGEALVVDPTRDLDQYFDLAEREGFRIAGVAETHIHADFASGARELAARSGARLYLSAEGTSDWQYTYASNANATIVRDGDRFGVGNIQLEVMHTPGHTPEHICFLLTDTAHARQPMGVFTGDFVFVGDVGRPDLLERAAGFAGTMDASARQLFHSLQRFATLPDYLQVWPGHGAGSACGKALGAVPQSTTGYEKRFNWAFQVRNEQEFVARVLDGQPSPPTYFAHMKRINKEGPALLTSLLASRHLHLHDLLEATRAAITILDTRAADAFAGGHSPGTVNIPLGPSFVSWAGWLVSYDRPFALIVDERHAHATIRQLRLIGLDKLAGYATTGVLGAWAASGYDMTIVPRTDSAGFRQLMRRDDVYVLDVREPAELALGAVPGSHGIPLGYLLRRLGEVPRDRTVAIYCQSGTRSAIGASLLAAKGYTSVVDLIGGFDAWRRHEQRRSVSGAVLTR
jgi:hydroxyacylglutathione hydrolase